MTELEMWIDDDIQQAIAKEHARVGYEGDNVNDTPDQMPAQTKQEAYDGMRFFVNVNDAKAGQSVTMHVIHGTWSRRENKRTLRKYLTELGYKSHAEHKTILKELGFWSKKQLGTTA